jgi:hypothetical protein
MTKAKTHQAAARRVGKLKLMNDEDFKIINLGESFAAVVVSHFTMTLFSTGLLSDGDVAQRPKLNNRKLHNCYTRRGRWRSSRKQATNTLRLS